MVDFVNADVNVIVILLKDGAFKLMDCGWQPTNMCDHPREVILTDLGGFTPIKRHVAAMSP